MTDYHCPNCGMKMNVAPSFYSTSTYGPLQHATPQDCIVALRARIYELEMASAENAAYPYVTITLGSLSGVV